MGLRKKTLILVGTAFLVLVTTLIITSRFVVLKGFTKLESQDVRLNIKRGLSEISNVLDGLNSTAGDWAKWDETYEFIQNLNEEYIKNNLNVDTLTNLRINFMLFINLSRELKFDKFVNLYEESEAPLPAGLREEVLSCNILIKHDHADSSKTGVLMFDNVPILVASQPILKSDFSGPIRGVLIIGRYLDSAEISRLSKINHLNIEIQPFKDSHMAPDFQRATSSISAEVPIFVNAESIKTIAG
jgi:sensor domain CHASE-containing protein